jgi:predicted nucleic acid-binding protein
MSVFVDTSAFYALLVRSETSHHPVRSAFERLLEAERPIWTTSFVLVETMALLQHRIGLDAAHDFDEDIVPLLTVVWVDEEWYRRGVARLRREDRRHLSLVDCVSFEVMTRTGLSTALAVDPHFGDAGFDVVPRSSR